MRGPDHTLPKQRIVLALDCAVQAVADLDVRRRMVLGVRARATVTVLAGGAGGGLRAGTMLLVQLGAWQWAGMLKYRSGACYNTYIITPASILFIVKYSAPASIRRSRTCA